MKKRTDKEGETAMKKFIPQQEPKPPQARFIMVRSNDALDLALTEAKKKTGIPRAKIARQMIVHCLADMGIIVQAERKP